MNIIKSIKLNLKHITTTLIAVAISVVLSITYTSYRAREFKQTKYVMVNTDYISKTFLSIIIQANLEDSQYQHILTIYDKKLTAVINKVSLQNNFIILKKGTILTELPDITEDIQSITFKELALIGVLKESTINSSKV
jgi:hypothetical protein